MRGMQTLNKPLVILSSKMSVQPQLDTRKPKVWMVTKTKRSHLTISWRICLKQQILQPTVQTLGQVFLDFDQRTLDRALETLHPG